MLCIPKSNHKKLVDDCYPAPKALPASAPEYRANANELGRLCYYAKNKPAKLTKVGRLLTARATAAKTALRASTNDRMKAELMITLAMIKEIVAVCPSGLTYLAPTVQSVIGAGFQAAAPGAAHGGWDGDLSARASSTFASYVRSLSPGAMEVDEDVPRAVFAVLDNVQPVVRGQQDEHTRLIGLGAFEGVVRSAVVYAPCFSRLLERLLPGLLDTLSPLHLPVETTAALAQHNEVDLPSAAERPADPEMTASAALVLLRHLVQGADAVQLRTFVRQTLAWFDAEGGKQWGHEAFSVWLLNLLTHWAPHASRYVVPHTLIDTLSSTEAVNASEVRSVRLLQSLHEILASQIEIVGLNMTELLEGHVVFLLAHVQRDPADATIGPTVDAIGHLARYPIYADQLSDFVRQINAHLRTVQSTTTLPAAKRDNSLRALLYAQMAVVRDAAQNSSYAAAPLTTWRDTSWLLLSPNPAVRFTYLQALLVHLDLATRAYVMQRGEAAYAPESDVLRFLHAFVANAYAVLARATYAPGVPLDAIHVGDSKYDVSQLHTVPADYAALLAVLERLYEVAPAAALLASVPALLALDHLAAQCTEPQTLPAARAARWVVGLALVKLATVWDVPALMSYIQAHILQPLGDVPLHAPALGASVGELPSFAPFEATERTAGASLPDVETVAEHLSASGPLQTVTNCDASTLRDWLLRNWSTTTAIQDAQIGAQPATRAASTMRTRISRSTSRVPPTIMRENTTSVSQLRMALANRGPSRPGSSLYVSEEAEGAGDTRSNASRSRRRSLSGQLGSRTSLSSLLDRYKVGEASVTPSAYGNAAAPAPGAAGAAGPSGASGAPMPTAATGTNELGMAVPEAASPAVAEASWKPAAPVAVS